LLERQYFHRNSNGSHPRSLEYVFGFLSQPASPSSAHRVRTTKKRLFTVPISTHLFIACLIAALFACDRDAPDSRFDPPELLVLESEPQPSESSFPLERALRLRFNRYLRPASVVRQSILVTPSIIDPDAGLPKGPTFFFEPVYDPFDRLVVFQLTARSRWVPSTLHTVRLFSPKDDGDMTGFRAFDGAPLKETESYSFMTGERESEPRDDRLPPVRYCEQDEGSDALPAVATVLRSSCGRAGCHGSSPALGLGLSTRTALQTTAVRVVARQTMTGASVSATASTPSRFGDDMPRIDPGNAANSYLVYKLLIHPQNHPGLHDGDTPDPWLGGLTPSGPPSYDELSRLRSWFVHGEPMPLEGHLSAHETRAIVRWIIHGAPTSDCLP
jgi:hypothetical protein